MTTLVETPAPVATPPESKEHVHDGGKDRTWILALLVFGGLVVAWELAARFVVGDKLVFPAPSQVVDQLWDDRDLYPENVKATLSAAAIGYVWGNVFAIVLGLVLASIPKLERSLLAVVVAFYCMPIIAIAPLLQVMFTGNEPQIVLAAFSVFFPTLIGTLLGFRSADRAQLELISSLGGGRVMQLTKVRLRAAVPGIFSGLCIAAPAALLGAIVGEFLGSTAGLGVLMVASLSTLETARAWGVAIVSALIAGGAFALIGYLGRRLNPWAPPTQGLRPPTGSDRGPSPLWWRIMRPIVTFTASVAVVLGLWILAMDTFGIPQFVARYPSQVWDFFFTSPTAAADRAVVLDALWITVQHAALGFLIGMSAACVVAILLVTFTTVRRIVMPLAIALQSIPIIAFTPIIVLAFGRDLMATLVIAAITTFFPTLVNVIAGLRSSSRQSIEMLESYGASRAMVLQKVQIPSALPSVFAAARIAAPAALLGVIVAEWLATGEGIGSTMVVDALSGRYDAAWAAGVAVTITSLCFYLIAGAVEKPVLKRYAPEQVAR